MMIPISSVSDLSDNDLLTHLQHAAHAERHATAQLIALLMELDARRLFLAQGYASLFTYCTDVLRLSEPAAYKRITAARAARRFPMILECLCDAAITLTTISILASHLTPANHVEVLDAACRKSKREVEHLVATLHPRQDVPAVVRKLPGRRVMLVSTEHDAVEPPKAQDQPPTLSLQVLSKSVSDVKPLAPERYKIQFTVDRATYEKLRRAQDLLRHSLPNGDPAAIFDRALTLLLEHLEKTKLAAVHRPRTERKPARGRHIPAAVKRAVWQRDAGYAACGIASAIPCLGLCRVDAAQRENSSERSWAFGMRSAVDST